MDLLINVILPLSLAIIMLSLGVGLEIDDFARVLRRKRAFAIGALSQMVLLPVVAFLLLMLFTLPPAIKAGIMLLSFCPGGVTSNIMSKLSRGDVALSVSLTAMVSLLSILTVPVLAALTVRYFMGEAAPDVTIAGLSVAVFLITTLPVLIGVALRRYARPLALRIEPGLTKLATALFALIVLAALIGSWDVFAENMGLMGEALVLLNVLMLFIGMGMARLGGLSWQELKTISIETGVQNGTMGITLAALITGVTSGFSEMALPSAVYGITMHLVVIPFILWFRRS